MLCSAWHSIKQSLTQVLALVALFVLMILIPWVWLLNLVRAPILLLDVILILITWDPEL